MINQLFFMSRHLFSVLRTGTGIHNGIHHIMMNSNNIR
jgi:hypothetical protein